MNSSFNSSLKALVNEDTLLRTHCCPSCFLGCANWETFVADTKCFWTKSETFLCPGHKICVRNKCCARGQTGKHLWRQQCVRNNVSSFAKAFRSRASVIIRPLAATNQTLVGSLWCDVIKTEFFCSNFRYLLNGNELKTQRKTHVYSITKNILTKMLHGKFSASCQYTKMRWDLIARPRKHLRHSCSLISLQCRILMELRDHGRRRTCPGLSLED